MGVLRCWNWYKKTWIYGWFIQVYVGAFYKENGELEKAHAPTIVYSLMIDDKI